MQVKQCSVYTNVFLLLRHLLPELGNDLQQLVIWHIRVLRLEALAHIILEEEIR